MLHLRILSNEKKGNISLCFAQKFGVEAESFHKGFSGWSLLMRWLMSGYGTCLWIESFWHEYIPPGTRCHFWGNSLAAKLAFRHAKFLKLGMSVFGKP